MAEPRPEALLKVLDADGATLRRFYLGPGEHLVGSAAEAAVPLDDGRVSRRHATIEVLDDGSVVLTDLGSKNGTYLHGRRIRRTALRDLAVLAFGPVQALLQPASGRAGEVLLGTAATAGAAGAPAARKAVAAPAPSGERATSHGLFPLGRLAAGLRELLPPLLSGAAAADATADALASRLLAVLPVGRVELLRREAGGEETIIAAASTSGRVPRALLRLDVTGPGGWSLRLRAADLGPLAPAEPLLELALDLFALAAGDGEARPSAVAVSAASAPSAGVRRKEAPAPPSGLGPEMARIYRRAGKVARGDVPVLILGESGSGKEVLARWIHARSRRHAGPLLAVNCAALPRELLEAELFGIERGVATGVEARAGILERASGGTVLLDEIGDMAAELQAKLLRVLESTSLYRVGGRNPVTVDVRFLAATNHDVGRMVEEGGFRRDLYHRLAAFEVALPPLRRRREEIPSLAARFFHRELAKAGATSPGITRAALGALVRYPWPGNVRELENEIAKSVLLLEPGEPLDAGHLSERVRALGAPGAGGAAPADPLDLAAAVERAEREAFAVAQAAAQGDPQRAMQVLGVSRTTYYRKLKELGLA